MAESKSNVATEMDFLGFLFRFLGALGLVLLTFNPSGYSVYHWVTGAIGESTFGPLHAIAVLALIVGWVIVIVATRQALDTLGVVLAALVLAAIVWLLIDVGILAADSVSAITWIVLVCLAVVLTIGMTWAHIWRRLTGQVSVDDLD
jgi:hypothetical protein